MGFPEIFFIAIIFLALPIWATVATLRRIDFSLTNKILLVALSWIVLFAGPLGVIGPILTLVIIYFNKPTEHNRLEE